MARKPVVAIVGRPNVGKSALFNRIVRRRIAIVEGTPGVTRDRLYADCEWTNRGFTLVDMGGLDPGAKGDIAEQTRRQAEMAMEEADVLLFAVDARDGLTGLDREVGEVVRRSRKPVIPVANKVDQVDSTAAGSIVEFYALGFGEAVPVSAEHGRNIGDLLSRVVELLPPQDDADADEDTVRVAVVGRPNVGKSSLINALLGKDRVIVSETPGTTRDAVDTPFEHEGQQYVLIDTAGLRRRHKVEEPLERFSVARAVRSVERCDVAVMVLDATQGVAQQDKRIAGIAHDEGRAVLLVVNKWDLVEKDNKTMQRFEQEIRRDLAYLAYAPLTFISAKTGQRVPEVLNLVEYVANQHALRISTGRVNEVLHEATSLKPPPSDKGLQVKIYYGFQARVKPPEFVLFVNRPQLLHFSYVRYLENRLREAFGFVGTPIRITARERR